MAKGLAAVCGGVILACLNAHAVELRDDFDSYPPAQLDGTQNAGSGFTGGWRPEFNDVGGVHHLAGTAEIRTDNPIDSSGPHLRLLGAGPRLGGAANGAARDLAGAPTDGNVCFQFDLRVDSLSGLAEQGDAIDLYLNGVESSGLTGGHNVSAWIAYRPDWLSGTDPGFDDTDWMVRNGHPTSEAIAPGESDRWIDTGVAVREGAVYRLAVTIDLDADTWALSVAEVGNPTPSIVSELDFFEVGNRATLSARQLVFAIREGSDAASNAAISIDNIAPISVPEPATVLLLACGGMLLRRRRRGLSLFRRTPGRGPADQRSCRRNRDCPHSEGTIIR